MKKRLAQTVGIVFLSGFVIAVWAEELIVNFHSERLHITAPQVHFLINKPLERLRNGATVTFDFQLSLLTDSNFRLRDRALERYAVSYDLWEEKFSVKQLRTSLKTSSLLTAKAAEAWCVENISLAPGTIGPDEPVWLRLEVRGGDGKESPIFGRDNIRDSGISLTSLIEIFSRPATSQQLRVIAQAGPLRLADLKRKSP